MNTFTKTLISSAVALGVSSASQAYIYSVYGSFTDPDNDIWLSTGSLSNSANAANLTISGYVETDSNQAGYSILGGSMYMEGWIRIPFSPGDLFMTFETYGSASNNGVVFNQGTICIGFFLGDCQPAFVDLSIEPAYFDGTGTWNNGYAGSQGLQLLGGAGGSMFTVDQPGYFDSTDIVNMLFGDAATGSFSIAGNNSALFLGGSLQFYVPLPTASWLFGSALLGLGALRRKH